MRPFILDLYEGLWASLAAPLIRRMDAHTAHERLIEAVRRLDSIDEMVALAEWVNRRVLPAQPAQVGGVTLPHPIILSAGFVKGDGFANEDSALTAVDAGRNVIPGWRFMPALVGAVEFGSFTRYPRLGNPGRVIWRDDSTVSTQNRVGLRNPGAGAAARFLAAHRHQLPPVFGINIAVSPGVTDPDREESEILEAAERFTAAFAPTNSEVSPSLVKSDSGQAGRSLPTPSWYTLNLSCPNTEDDPGANQTEAKARRLCGVLVAAVHAPVWVKISPDLSSEQVVALMRVFAETGVRAVIASNTLAQPTPDGSALGGVGGGGLRDSALAVVRWLSQVKGEGGYAPDIIGCGGILNGSHLETFRAGGAAAFMVYSALVFRGPLAAALILGERA